MSTVKSRARRFNRFICSECDQIFHDERSFDLHFKYFEDSKCMSIDEMLVCHFEYEMKSGAKVWSISDSYFRGLQCARTRNYLKAVISD